MKRTVQRFSHVRWFPFGAKSFADWLIEFVLQWELDFVCLSSVEFLKKFKCNGESVLGFFLIIHQEKIQLEAIQWSWQVKRNDVNSFTLSDQSKRDSKLRRCSTTVTLPFIVFDTALLFNDVPTMINDEPPVKRIFRPGIIRLEMKKPKCRRFSSRIDRWST